ncbi:hypothetical protein KC316_g2511 [Hortaea werneckii]|nr:hypothetical protein KC324_g2499 [Hortaea werneckii]KAI7592064.1 hypothetical protein KC316_g2511 [Hortaea werneckii]
MADDIITSLDKYFKIALDARLHPLASADLAGQVHEHRVRIEHLRDDIPAPQWFSGEVFNAYCDLLRETFCAPGEDVEDDLAVALLPLEFAVALRDQATAQTSDIALDPRNFAEGIDGSNFFRYRAIFIPIHFDDHYTLAIVEPHDQVIKHFDSLQPAAHFTLADAACAMLGRPPIISGNGANAQFDYIKAWVRGLVGHEDYKSFTAVSVEMAPQQASLSGDCAVLVLLEMRLLLAEIDLDDLQYLEDEEMGQLGVEFRYRIMAELVCQKLNPTMQDLPPWHGVNITYPIIHANAAAGRRGRNEETTDLAEVVHFYPPKPAESVKHVMNVSELLALVLSSLPLPELCTVTNVCRRFRNRVSHCGVRTKQLLFLALDPASLHDMAYIIEKGDTENEVEHLSLTKITVS